MYDVETNSKGLTHATLRPPSKLKMSEYDLTNVRIERAENGCTIECNFRMKPETEKSLRGKDGKNYVDYDIRNITEKHVFNDIGEAAQFMESRLLGKDWQKHEKAEAKMKVRKV